MCRVKTRNRRYEEGERTRQLEEVRPRSARPEPTGRAKRVRLSTRVFIGGDEDILYVEFRNRN